MNTITTEQLRSAKCSSCGDEDPECEGLVLASQCHPEAGAKVVYQKAQHCLRITCAACSKHVIDIRLPSLN